MNIIILDDNRAVLESIKQQILNICGRESNIFEYVNMKSLFDDMDENVLVPDIAFLDIKIGEENCIGIAGEIKKNFPLCQIIFMSGYDDYYIDVYEVEHVYFLKKPINEDDLIKAVKKATERLERDKLDVFSFMCNRMKYAVHMKEITYFEKDRRKMKIFLNDGTMYEFYSSMEDVLNSLTSDFIRCHNSYIVNMSHVEVLSSHDYIMKDGKTVPISRSYSKICRIRFSEFVGSMIQKNM